MHRLGEVEDLGRRRASIISSEVVINSINTAATLRRIREKRGYAPKNTLSAEGAESPREWMPTQVMDLRYRDAPVLAKQAPSAGLQRASCKLHFLRRDLAVAQVHDLRA